MEGSAFSRDRGGARIKIPRSSREPASMMWALKCWCGLGHWKMPWAMTVTHDRGRKPERSKPTAPTLVNALQRNENEPMSQRQQPR
jgi:hypothetical protein